MILEHQFSAEQLWQPMHFVALDLQAPFVLQLAVPQYIAKTRLRLRLVDWQLHYMVDLQQVANSNLYGPHFNYEGPCHNAVVIGDMHMNDADTAAQILAVHMTHHMALGFDVYLLYAQDLKLVEAVLANAVTASFVSSGLLQIVSSEFLLKETKSQLGQSYSHSSDQGGLAAYHHATLMLWGERFHLAVLDVDEYLSSHASTHSWSDTCFPKTDVIMSEHVCARVGLCKLQCM